jgi:SAM-dependent methyltransferase
MLIEEARWLSHRLSELSPAKLYPMCNLGSSTEHYRRVDQPYIDKYLFAPARARNLKVVHVDAKPAVGVDIVGDLTNPGFLTQLARLNVRSVMCCNLLEHVRDRAIVCDAILSILKPGGYVIATVPYKFPYHEDPIDTLYRPTIKELAASFLGTSMHKARTVRASRFAHEMKSNYSALYRIVARVALPFYRPERWWANLRRLGELAAGYQVTCVILRKQGGTLED